MHASRCLNLYIPNLMAMKFDSGIRILAILVEPANYTLDLVRNVYEKIRYTLVKMIKSHTIEICFVRTSDRLLLWTFLATGKVWFITMWSAFVRVLVHLKRIFASK